MDTRRQKTLQTAAEYVCGDRNQQYGNPIDDFRGTAAMWSVILDSKLREPLDAHEVAAMMIAVKLSRLRVSPGKQDHWVDIAGYAACGSECAEIENA